jgi:hypothetical protein
MKAPRLFACFCVSVLSFGAASPALALVNRVFVSFRSGNNANACDNVNTPCQTFAGAVTQLNPNGEVIVLDSGDYGSFMITQGVTIEAPAGVTAYCHPPSGDAITINAGPLDGVDRPLPHGRECLRFLCRDDDSRQPPETLPVIVLFPRVWATRTSPGRSSSCRQRSSSRQARTFSLRNR